MIDGLRISWHDTRTSLVTYHPRHCQPYTMYTLLFQPLAASRSSCVYGCCCHILPPPVLMRRGREWVSPLSGPASLTYWTPFLPTFANHSRLSGVACIGIQWRLIYTVITLPEGNGCIYSWPWMISSPKSVTCLYTNVNCKTGFMKGTLDNFSTSLTNILCKFMWNDLIIYWDI